MRNILSPAFIALTLLASSQEVLALPSFRNVSFLPFRNQTFVRLNATESEGYTRSATFDNRDATSMEIRPTVSDLTSREINSTLARLSKRSNISNTTFSVAGVVRSISPRKSSRTPQLGWNASTPRSAPLVTRSFPDITIATDTTLSERSNVNETSFSLVTRHDSSTSSSLSNKTAPSSPGNAATARLNSTNPVVLNATRAGLRSRSAHAPVPFCNETTPTIIPVMSRPLRIRRDLPKGTWDPHLGYDYVRYDYPSPAEREARWRAKVPAAISALSAASSLVRTASYTSVIGMAVTIMLF